MGHMLNDLKRFFRTDLSKKYKRDFHPEKQASQGGEDGIIAEIMRRLKVNQGWFVEFGAWDGVRFSNTYALALQNWRGIYIEGDPEKFKELQANMRPHPGIVNVCRYVSLEGGDSLDSILGETSIPREFDLLSIDIDGNDYWVWDAIKSVDPAIVICEYNPILGDMRALVVPYDPHFTRFNAHHSGLYFGCSIAALRQLAAKRGYTFVGTNSNGINAFFVRDDLAGPVLAGIEAVRAYPSRHRDSRDEKGQLSFTGGLARFDLIRHLEVVDVSSRQRIRLDRIEKPYSDEWLDAMR